MYKLSPSDFKYLWEECKHCFYRKIHEDIRQPSIGIPNIFTRMSGLLQKSVQGSDPHDLCPDLPNGEFTLEEGWLESKPLPSGNSYIKGRFDLLSRFNDGTYGVIDVKMTGSRDEDLQKFERQLHAYKYAMESPAVGNSISISRLGLLIVAPTDIKPHQGFVYYKAKPVWKEIEINMDKFFSFVEEMEQLLDGPIPEPSNTCEWCKYRHGERVVNAL